MLAEIFIVREIDGWATPEWYIEGCPKTEGNMQLGVYQSMLRLVPSLLSFVS
jgi:hypothetical protein